MAATSPEAVTARPVRSRRYLETKNYDLHPPYAEISFPERRSFVVKQDASPTSQHSRLCGGIYLAGRELDRILRHAGGKSGMNDEK